MKRTVAILLALAMIAAAFAGCAASTTTTTTSGSSASASASGSAAAEAAWDTSKNDEIVLSVINNYYTAGWKKMATDYMAAHPETKVTVDVVADNDTYTQKMTTWLTSDNLNDSADIVHINFAAGPVGGYSVGFEKGIFLDLKSMLDETNPYGSGKVRDEFNEDDLMLYQDSGKWYSLPFDWVGVAIMYNKQILDDNGITLPLTYEKFAEVCQKLRDGGMETPIAASGEASWYLSAFADAALRSSEETFLVQPDDAVYDSATMSANDGFKWNEDDWTCDMYTVFSGERVAAYKKEKAFKDDITKTTWEQFSNIAKYFTPNYAASASTEVLTSFEMGKSAFLLSGSWNVGVLNADMAELGNSAFEWGTMPFPSYENAPDGLEAKIRTLYVSGNTMGIINKGDADHQARVKDFFKFVYCKNGCQDMFNTTLNAGNFVQGPPAIKGVELSEELNMKLEGFVQKGTLKGDFGGIVGQDAYLAEDQGAYIEGLNNLLTGKIDVNKWIDILSPIGLRYVDDVITKNGYDLDFTTKDTPKA